jgi:hypothetical protein
MVTNLRLAPWSTANLFAIQDQIAKSIVDHLAAFQPMRRSATDDSRVRRARPDALLGLEARMTNSEPRMPVRASWGPLCRQ